MAVVIKLPKDRDQEAEQLDLIEDEVYIGHMSGCQIHLKDKLACPVHARIFHQGPTYFIEDLRSINGTTINGTSINAQAQLNDGDIIGIGEENLAFSIEKIHTPETVYLFSRKASSLSNGGNSLGSDAIESKKDKTTKSFTLGPRPAIPVAEFDQSNELQAEINPAPIQKAIVNRSTHKMDQPSKVDNPLAHNIEETVKKISTSIYRSSQYKRYLKYINRQADDKYPLSINFLDPLVIVMFIIGFASIAIGTTILCLTPDGKIFLIRLISQI